MKFPFFHQLDSNDCGATCLKMICSYYGKNVSLHELRKLCDPDMHGVTVKDLAEAAGKTGFETEAVLISIEDIQRMPLPAILYWNQNHFVVLYKIDTKRQIYYIANPAFGKLKLNKNDFFESWIGADVDKNTRGVAILLDAEINVSNRNYKQKSEYKQAVKQIVTHIKTISQKFSKWYIISIILVLVSLLMNWAIPILFQKTIDSGIGAKNISLVQLFILGQLACAIGYIFFSTLYDLLLLKINFKVSTTFLEDFLGKVIKLPLFFFLRRVSSDLLQRIQDLELLQRFLTRHVIRFLITTANFILFLSLLVTYSLIIVSIFLFSSLAILGWISIFFKKRAILDFSRFEVLSDYRNNYFELISGMSDIKINNASNTKVQKSKSLLQKTNNLLLQTLYVENYQIVGVNILDNIKNYFILGLCAYWVVEGRLSLGEMISINYIIGQLSGSINFYSNFVRDFQDAQISVTRLNEINNTHSEIRASDIYTNVTLSQGVYFKNVSFKYSSNQAHYVIKDISFAIPKGKVTAFVGESGSGKTTILKLLLGFYPVQTGEILLDDKNLNEVNIEKWRSMCGAVLQDGYIFSGTFMENIALADMKPDVARVIYAAKIACINDFIESLPMQYNTLIGKNGIMLSGGEKQRILIARAVYKNPEFLLLDEATNSLDSINELKISENLNKFYKDKTVVIIAHRLSTIRNADTIIVLNHGKVAEVGNHEILIDRKNIYYNLIKNQLR